MHHPVSDLKNRLKRLRHGDPFHAYDLAKAAGETDPEDIFFPQVQAHALAQTGSPQGALRILESLYEADHRDPETLGLLGRTWKDLANDARTAEERHASLLKARGYYREGLEEAEARGDSEGYYPGINAAALSVLLGDEAAAQALATRASHLAEHVPTPNYWSVATCAEAALIQRQPKKAEQLYRESARFSPPPEQTASTRRQARLLSDALYGRADLLDSCFHVPPVLVFIGHLTDQPNRPAPRFPEEMVEEVSRKMEAVIQRHGAMIGYAGAARGGDLIFLGALKAAGAETQIVLPLEREEFLRSSVEGSEPGWVERYERALAEAHAVRIANSHSSTADGAAFEYGTRILIGMALIRARQLDTEMRALVLWDGKAGDGHGGTAWAISHLRKLGVPIENIYPGQEGLVTAPVIASPGSGELRRSVHALLFADCKGYSRLREEQIGDYTRRFLEGVARLISRMSQEGAAPVAANTWGDGLFMAFQDVHAAGRFALALRDGVRNRARELDIPEEVRLRIGLHAGPVMPFTDPVTGRLNFAGVNVAFAARIEPIARENQVCVSEPFAALAADAGLDEFRFDYLGATPFAKDYGTYPLYQLRPRREE